MDRRLHLAAAVVIALLLMACSRAGVSQVVEEEGADIMASVGETFAIRVSANPGVGYEWDLVEPRDTDIVEHMGFFYLDEGEQPGGDDVTVDYRFEAVAPGSTTIVLRRSYRGDVEDPPVERVHEVTVTQ